MVNMRDNVPDPIKQRGEKLSRFLRRDVGIEDDEQVKAARRRFEKAVFHSHYTVDQFEDALDQHRHKMRELGEAINDLLNEFRKEWDKGTERGHHSGYANRAIARAYFKRIISIEERIDMHLKKFEEKLNVLTAWRQYKIQNDIGSEVDTTEVQEWVNEEFDRSEVNGTTFEEQEGSETISGIREDSGGPIVSEKEEEKLNQFVESEFGESGETTREQETDQSDEEEMVIEESTGDGDSGDPAVDDEIEEFLENEGLR